MRFHVNLQSWNEGAVPAYGVNFEVSCDMLEEVSGPGCNDQGSNYQVEDFATLGINSQDRNRLYPGG